MYKIWTYWHNLCIRCGDIIIFGQCCPCVFNSRFVTVFSVCKVFLQSFDITPPKSFLSIIIIITVFTHCSPPPWLRLCPEVEYYVVPLPVHSVV